MRMRSRIIRLTSATALATLVGFTSSWAASAAPSSEISYWALNETTIGTPARDSIGTNIGEAFGSPQPTPSTDVPFTENGNTGSMLFDGQNYIKVNNTLSADFSICAWIKTQSTGGSNHWENAPIVMAEQGGFAYDYGFGVNSEGKLSFGNGGNITESAQADQTIAGNKLVNDNTWHHVCVSRNNSNGEIALYVDGALDATGVTGLGLINSNSEAWIGHGQDGNAPFVGLIDEVRFYSSVLTLAEIQEIFAPAPPVEEATNEPEEELVLADTGFTTENLLLMGIMFLFAGSMILILKRVRN